MKEVNAGRISLVACYTARFNSRPVGREGYFYISELIDELKGFRGPGKKSLKSKSSNPMGGRNRRVKG